MSGESRALFLCSNRTHVETFGPVIGAYRAAGGHPLLATLDEFYGQGAEPLAMQRGLALLYRSHRQGNAQFYGRSPLAIWKDVLAARHWVSQLLKRASARVVVVGNDSGLIEKLVLTTAGARGMKRVLVQDGRLGEAPRTDNLLNRLLKAAKVGLSYPLAVAGLPYLAASEYGAGPVDLVCASGRNGQTRIGQLAPSVPVLLTGQPRYDRLRELADRGAESHAACRAAVTVFTTPFAVDRLGTGPQRAQEAMVAGLSHALMARGIRLVLKPHPREVLDGYRRAAPALEIWTGDPAELLVQSFVAVIGISSVVEEAAILRCPVIVPGEFIHGGRFDAKLPPASVYPRFETTGEALALIRQIESGELTAAPQSAAMMGEIFFDPVVPAAVKVARALLVS